MRFNKVKYKFINHDNGTNWELRYDPKNWEKSDRTLKRSTKYWGVFTELSKNLEFVKEDAKYLRNAYLFKDIEADVELQEWRLHPIEETWYLHSTGVFDFSAYKENKLTVKISFKSSGLNSIIQSQLREKFELERLESINGKVLEPLETVNVALTSRKILLISALNNAKTSYAGNNTSGFFDEFIPQLNIESNSDQENVTNVIGDENFTFSPTNTSNVNSNQMFYFNSNVAKTINFKIDWNIICSKGGFGTTKHILRIYKYNYNSTLSSFSYVHEYLITETNYGSFTTTGTAQTDIILNQGDCLMLYYSPASGNGTGNNNAFQITKNDIKIDITEESIRADSQTKAILKHEEGDRLMQITTGEKNRFYSDLYGRTELSYPQTGQYALTASALGFWIRKFDEKNIQTSLDNYFKTSDAIHCIGYTIQKMNGIEKLRVEERAFFFQQSTAIIIENQVSNIERTVAKDFSFSSLEFGYKKGGDYEEAMGLDEYNIKTGYTLPIKRSDAKYSSISESRADAYGKEFARRKPKLNYPQEDTRYDKDIHLLDLKKGMGLNYEERVWQDDYETVPTGIFSPNTATNLRLTPFRNSERHQRFFSPCLRTQQDEKVRYSNSEGNNNLVTKKANEVARAEKGDVNIAELQKPLFTNQYVTFEAVVDYELNKKIYGSTVLNGQDVPNYFFKVQYLNEYGLKETGWLFELKQKQSDLYTFKILKSA